MIRIVSVSERLSSVRASRPQWSSLELAIISPYVSQRPRVLKAFQHPRYISSRGSLKARHWEGPRFATRSNNSRHDDSHSTPVLTTQPSSNGSLAVPREAYDFGQESEQSPFPNEQEEQKHQTNFYRAIEDGQPDLLMIAMTDPRSAGLVGSLPQTTFLEALHRLSPAHFVEPYRDLHHPLHSWSTLLDGLKRAEQHFDEFVANLLTIVEFRTAVQPLHLEEYTHLLDCARSMGNEPFATQIWKAMERRGIAPSATCYNHYMEALVWDHCYTGKEAYRLRMLPRHYYKRRKRTDCVGWRGYGTGTPNSVRHAVLEIFNTMLQEGHLPDERTYINLLIAGARVGHIKGMSLVLKTIWNIDLAAMKAQQTPDNSKLPQLTSYDPWSALHPTENLLFAVAHALGTNNDMPSAIRAIQLISSKYNIPISQRVWLDLIERSYILGRARMKEHDTQHSKFSNSLGRVSLSLVQSVFNASTSGPDNASPSMQAYRYMVNVSIHNGNLKECKDLLRDAYKLLHQTRQRQIEARKVVLRCMKPALEVVSKQRAEGVRSPDPHLFRSPQLANAIHAYDIIRLQVYQQTYLLRRSCWSVFTTQEWNDTSHQAWQWQERPNFMEEWKDFLPETKTVHYEAETGQFLMHGRTTRWARHWTSDQYRIPVRRVAHKGKLFVPVEPRRLTEQRIWYHVLKSHKSIDRYQSPLNKLFQFETPPSPELRADVQRLNSTWTEYPEESQWNSQKNPNAGFYGRLAALNMLKPERSIYYLDDKTWI
ncbi:hypothetical protein PENSTE_c004G01152 [Penicillium steckii]|uniref:Uncharacterized protein n=1 Tax=Penicillium steckii TaxID=303698 RepID=A0A1V6TMI1_9EURO|nr:hypothetical protein PENSTE_c004G01152 [Penicillium steckii]